ncbi:MAG: DMT family transporter [Promethearchaeota archaeon]
MSALLLGVITGLLSSAINAIATVGYQSQIEGSSTFIVNCIKTWAALPVMLGAVVIFGSASVFSVPLHAQVSLILSMLIGATIADTFYLAGQKRIGVSYALPIVAMFPIFTYILAIILLGDSPIVSRFLGIAIAVIGVMFLSKEQANVSYEKTGFRTVDKTGLLLALIASILLAGGILLIQVGVEGVDPITAATIRLGSGSAIMVPFGFLAKAKGYQIPSSRSTKIIIISGALGMGVAAIFWVVAIKYAGAVLVSVLGTTSPLFAIPISVVILKESITRRGLTFIVVIVIGVATVILGA